MTATEDHTVVTQGAYGAGKIVGEKAAEVTVAVATDGAGRAINVIRGAGREAAALGDLTTKEVKQIQSVVDNAERPLEVVGSAARGARRGVGTDLPTGKGPGTKSDIDYMAPPSHLPYFEGLQNKLPSIDPATGVFPGTGNPYMGPIIRFEPGTAPTFTPKAN